MEYTKFTSEDFLTYSGVILDDMVPDDSDISNKVTRFIDNVCEQILDFIRANSRSNFTNITTEQNDIINRAAMMQAEWVLKNGDLTVESGLNPISGADVSTQFRKLEISPRAKRLLLSTIIYRGV
jgi:hypothetical protein